MPDNDDTEQTTGGRSGFLRGCLAILVVVVAMGALGGYVVQRIVRGNRAFKSQANQLRTAIEKAQGASLGAIRERWLVSARKNPSFDESAYKFPKARKLPIRSFETQHSISVTGTWRLQHVFADPTADFSKPLRHNHKVSDLSLWCSRGLTQVDVDILIVKHGEFPANEIFLEALREQLNELGLEFREIAGPPLSFEEYWRELEKLRSKRESRGAGSK